MDFDAPTLSFAAAILLHGPIDVGLTALTWDLEGNTLVTQIGFETWVIIKAILILVLIAVWWAYHNKREIMPERAAIYFSGIWSGLAVVLILPNAFIQAQALFGF